MSSSSNPPSGGNDCSFRRYFCRQCFTNVVLNPSVTSSLLCPICPHRLTEIFDASIPTLRPINPDAEPFISRKAMFERRDPDDDYFYVISEVNFFNSPYYPNDYPYLSPSTDGSVVSFRSLCEYMNHCLDQGVSINSLSWSPIKLSGLPDVKMTEDVLSSNGAQCTVCMENFKIGEEAKQLPCRHLYHYGCIFSWIEQRATCPICRLKLTTDVRFFSVPSEEMGGSGEQIFVKRRSNNMPRIFEIELRWPINSRIPQFDESGVDSVSNEGSELEEQEGR